MLENKQQSKKQLKLAQQLQESKETKPMKRQTMVRSVILTDKTGNGRSEITGSNSTKAST